MYRRRMYTLKYGTAAKQEVKKSLLWNVTALNSQLTLQTFLIPKLQLRTCNTDRDVPKALSVFQSQGVLWKKQPFSSNEAPPALPLWW